MELFEALDTAHAGLHGAIASAVASGWDNASPCEGWTVRDVAQHIVGGAVRYRLLLEGGGEAELAPTRTADHLGDDAADAAARRSAELMAVARAADLDALVQHPTGPRTGAQLLNLRVMEATVHAWDIRTGAGLDSLLDPQVCAFVLARFDDMGDLGGFFSPAAAHGGDDPQAELLLRTGRRPGPA